MRNSLATLKQHLQKCAASYAGSRVQVEISAACEELDEEMDAMNKRIQYLERRIKPSEDCPELNGGKPGLGL